MGKITVLIVGLILGMSVTAQPADSLQTVAPKTASADTVPLSSPYEDLMNAPARAAFYSAVLPGLGQAYNKQYWKIPVVYAALGGAAYFYRMNQQEYLRYRQAYQDRLLGYPDAFPDLSTDVLIAAQSYYRRNRDISLMVLVGFYVLNILDANVSAHLRQWDIDDRLSLQWAPPLSIPYGGPAAPLSMRLSWSF